MNSQDIVTYEDDFISKEGDQLHSLTTLTPLIDERG